MSAFLRKYQNELGLTFAILVVVCLTSLLSDVYLNNPGMASKTILRETAMVGIFALGAAVVIISGGIDLSSGSVIALSGTVFFGVIVLLAPNQTGSELPNTDELPSWIPLVALAVTVFVGFLIGSFHTWLITVIKLPPFVATLASLVGLRSLARLLIQDMTEIRYSQRQSTITVSDEFLTSISRELWWIPVVVWLIISAAVWVLLRRTVTGRHIYAMGGNEEAAQLSGIRTDRLKWLSYCLGSMTAAIAGVMYACYIGTASPSTDGMGYELNAIAAAVVGGCSLTGGMGTIAGVMLGTLFLRVVIDSVAKLFKSQPDLFEGLVVGLLVILAVAFNALRDGGGLKKKFFPGGFGWLNVGILSLLMGTVIALTSTTQKFRNGGIALGITLVLLSARAVTERMADRKLTRRSQV